MIDIANLKGVFDGSVAVEHLKAGESVLVNDETITLLNDIPTVVL